MKKQALKFLNDRFYCVISSVNSSIASQSAFVAYSVNNSFEVIFGTSSLPRKYQNIMSNKSVSVVVADKSAEVQYEGLADLVSDSERKDIEALHIERVPGAEKYRNDPNQVYFKITPTWMRFVRHGDPDAVEEFTEFKS